SGQLIWGCVNGVKTTNICGVTAAKTYLLGLNAGLFRARRLLRTADDGIHKFSKAFEMMGTLHKSTIRYHMERGLNLDSLRFVGEIAKKEVIARAK
ncbi:hypothetical protein M8C21_018317, partial [Ambrosia artemisiifolia]